jgi:hypothetical protein
LRQLGLGFVKVDGVHSGAPVTNVGQNVRGSTFQFKRGVPNCEPSAATQEPIRNLV